MRTEHFLAMLEERGVLQSSDIQSLREQLEESPDPVHPTFIARRLVSVGFLNPFFAKTLLLEGAKIYGAAEYSDSAGAGGGDDLHFADAEDEKEAEKSFYEEFTAVMEGVELVPVGGMDFLLQDPDNAELLPGVKAKASKLGGMFGKKEGWMTYSTQRASVEKRLVVICAVLGAVILAQVLLIVLVMD
ncbi:MAG: hypothetical protein N2C12_17110 [Planctomycetales bacterium]